MRVNKIPKKRVLIITVEFPPACGGAGNAIWNHANRMAETYDVSVMTFAGSVKAVDQRYELIEVKKTKKIFPLLFAGKLRELNLNSYDAIILNDIGAALIGCLFLSDDVLSRVLVFVHGSEPEKIVYDPKILFRMIGFGRKYERMLEHVKGIVFVSDYMKEKMKKAFPRNTFRNSLIIHNSVDGKVFYPDLYDLRNELGIRKQSVVMMSSGRVIKEKGFDEAYQLFKKLVADGKDMVWIIAGIGAFLDEIKADIVRDNLSDRVFILGNLPQEKLRQVYSTSDFVLFLSRLKEAFPISCMESIMCGTPVIARNTGGVSEVVLDNVTGRIVESADDAYKEISKESYKDLKISPDSDYRYKDYSFEWNKLVTLIG